MSPQPTPSSTFAQGPLPEGRGGTGGSSCRARVRNRDSRSSASCPMDFGTGHGLEGHPPKKELAQGRRHSRRQGRRGQQGIRVFLTDSAQPFGAAGGTAPVRQKYTVAHRA